MHKTKKIATGRLRREERQREAIKRNGEYALLTHEQKVARLPLDGARKQRKQLGV